MQIYDGGIDATAPDTFYFSHPVELDGTEIEGGSGTPTADTTQTIPVDVLWHVPSVGDILVAYAVGGRWVAERGGPASVPLSPCHPCGLPLANLVLSWTNTLTGPGSTTLVYNGNPHSPTWKTGCVNNLLFQILCAGGEVEFDVTYFISGVCPTGQPGICSNLTPTPTGWRN